MVLVVGLLAAALVAGRLRGGRVRALAETGFRAGWLLAVGVVARLALAFGIDASGSVLVVAQLTPLGFAWANRALPGMPLVGLGAALNAAVILANGAMPVAASGATGRHRPLAPGHALPLLADVLPLPGALVSVGDLVLAAGLAVLVPALMRRPA